MLDDGIAFLGSHRARAEGVPGGFDVALDPFFDVLDVSLAVFEVFVEVALVAVEETGFGWLGWLDGQGPGAMLDAGCDVAWEGVGFGGGKIHVFGSGFRVEIIEWVLEKSASKLGDR